MSVERKKIERTSAGLRDALFNAMEQLREGDIEASDAKAMAALAREIVHSVQLEIEVQKLRAQYPSDTGIIAPMPLKLGTDDA